LYGEPPASSLRSVSLVGGKAPHLTVAQDILRSGPSGPAGQRPAAGPVETNVVIRSGQDCEAAASRARLFDHAHVDLDVGIDAGDERRAEAHLNRLRDECGCTWTALTLLATFVPALVVIWATRPPGASASSAIALSTVAFFAAAVLASVVKLSTITVARKRYRRALGELAERLRDERPGSGHAA
jgi:hypothetical protein